MPYVVTTDVFCDRCIVWTDGHTGHRVNKRKAWANAKEQGWTRRQGQDGLVMLCPECTARADQEGE